MEGPRMDLALRQRLEQRLKLAPQIIQSIQILQLPAIDLRELIQKELEDNPLVEVKDVPEDEQAAPLPEEELHSKLEKLAENEGRLDADYMKLDEMQDFFEEQQTVRRSYSFEGEDRKQEALQNTAARPVSLQEYMLEQFNNIEPPERLAALGRSIIYNIDDNGYLMYPLNEIIGSDDEEALKEAQEALELVQSVDPPGVGARDLSECLLLQTGPGRKYKLERLLIREYLDDIVNNRVPRIAKKTGTSIKRVNKAIEFIRGLTLHPGAVISGQPAPFVAPDVVIENIDGDYEIRLEDTYIPQIYINPGYRQLLKEKGADPKVREYVRRKLESARRLSEAIEQRKSTLQRISTKLVEIQKDFLENGVSHLKPLKMQEVADEVGVHVSTVSRAISDKFIQTPRGVYPMKFFFTGGAKTSDGAEEQSTRAIKQQLVELIAGEDRESPLSDADIVKEFNTKGLNIARRTVTKYRKAMKIPSSRQRRKY
jgi:RNA polymerase sigma-54 factor